MFQRLSRVSCGCLVLGLFASVVAGCGSEPQNPRTGPRAHKSLRHVARKEPASDGRLPARSTATGSGEWLQQVERDPVPTKEGGILAPDLLDEAAAEVPPVVMTEQHAVTCLARVGDRLPEARLPDLRGREQELAKLRGDRLTVVFFFSTRERQSVDELGDMAQEVASPLAPRGVKVVGICEQDAPAAARRTCDELGVSFPVLVDPGGKYFRQIATAHLPRTYLIDAQGRIVWFDIEYSRATHRELREALRALL